MTTVDKWEEGVKKRVELELKIYQCLVMRFGDGTGNNQQLKLALEDIMKTVSHSLQQARENIHRAYLAQQDNYGAEPEFAEAGWRDLLKQSDLLTKDV